MSERFTVQVDIEAKDKTQQALGSAKKGFKEAFSQVLTGALRTAGASLMGFATQLPQVAGQMVQLGASLQATEQRFERFAGGADRASEFLSAFQRGTDNTVDRMSAMGSASRLLQMGLVGTADEMEMVSAIAVRLGDQTMDAGNRIADFAALLANQSIPRLDNFGISSGRVRERINELLKSGQAISREDAFKMAVMEEGAKALNILGDTSGDVATNMAQVSSAWENIKLSASSALTTVLASTGVLEEFSQDMQTVAGTVDDLAQLRVGWDDLGWAMMESLKTGKSGAEMREELIARLEQEREAAEEAGSFQRALAQAYAQQATALSGTTQATESYSVTLARQAGMGDFARVSMERMAAASAANIEALQAQQEAAENTAMAQAGLAANLKDATDAQIAQTAIMQLGEALENGEISLETYTTAVTETQLAFGLADEQSIFLTESLGGLTEALADGSLKATDYDEALADVIMESEAAGVEVGVFANALDGLPSRVDIEIVTTYKTIGSPPKQVGDVRAGGEVMQRGTAFAGGGLALVGERGPELAMIPRGSMVFPADQSRHIVNNFNLAVNSQQSSMGVANEFELMRGLVA